jgi:hypothetical protein
MMRKTLCVAAVAALLLVSTPASAEWTIQKHPLGPGWTVSNGTYVVNMPDEKSAKKAAKALNEADKKADKRDKRDSKK